MKRLTRQIRHVLRYPPLFALHTGNLALRPYQEQAIQAAIESVVHNRALTFVWIFPRQSGKDEALAVLVQLLLVRSMEQGGEIVFFNPTFSPQTETSMRRLEARLGSNLLTRGIWQRRDGYIYRLGNAYCTYLSADPSAHVVSATANLLLIVNEAQDVGILKYDRDISPMAASADVTRVISGTRWTSNTLLEREYRFAIQAEARDRRPRIFLFTADDVREHVPAFGRNVDDAVVRLGRQHPLVKTQFFCEKIDAQAGMFPPGRQALMYGSHAALTAPEPGKMYAFLIDVAGQDEITLGADGVRPNDQSPQFGGAASLPPDFEGLPDDPGRDSTFLKIVEIDMATVAALGKPAYKVVQRHTWTGEKHVTVFGALRGLAAAWRPDKIVIDATGVGEGLWSLLEHALGERVVMPVKFTSKLKSELGYGFLEIVESGRYHEYSPFDETFRLQLDHALAEIVPGPAKLMRWSVPDGTRDPVSGASVHDDDLVTAALCVLLDRLEWRPSLPGLFVPARDPLEDMDRHF